MSVHYFLQVFHSDLNDWFGPIGKFATQEQAEAEARALFLVTEDDNGNPISMTDARILQFESKPRFTPKGARKLSISEKLVKTIAAQ
jgi:hypothetical protein